MQESPTITILLAAHNRHQLIGATLDSIRTQTHTNWECIIVDDYSTDTTYEVIEKYIGADKRFSLFQKAGNYKKGLPGSRNYALDIAAGKNPEYIQFFDDDDLMHPQKLEMQLNDLLQHQDNKFSLCGRLNFEDESEINYTEIQKITWPSNIEPGEAFLNGNLRFGVQATLLKYEFVKDHRFDEELEYAEDWVYFSNLLFQSGSKFCINNKILFYRRKHAMSMTGVGVKEINRKGSEVMAGIKIFNYLTHYNRHTRYTLYYFTRRFLLYQYDSSKIDQLNGIIKDHSNCSNYDQSRFKLAVKIHGIFRKSILRILKFT